MTIRSFADKRTKQFFTDDECLAKWQAFRDVAARKLDLLDAATSLNDLRSPPGNRLEALKGDRNGQHSIRVNDQWRICFRWTTDGPEDVEFVDYH
jgi:toxin HigB-1